MKARYYMGVRVEVLPREDAVGPGVVLTRPGPAGPTGLEHETPLTAGVRLRVDLARPADWRRLSLRDLAPANLPLIRAVLGDRATRALEALGSVPTSQQLAVAPAQAAAWVRIAVVHGLDRWLHLPLEQDLLHAEIGLATHRAARELPEGAEARELLTDVALGWARRASAGAARFLHSLYASPLPVPPALARAADALTAGYAALRELVTGPDARLTEVVEIGEALRRRSPALQPLPPRPAPTTVGTDPGPAARAVSLIDPRQVRARVLRLGDGPQTAEIALTPARVDGEDALRVVVPAFERRVDPEIADRLVARLVDRFGRDHSFAPLTVRSRRSLFECTIPLRGSDPRTLKADVFDALLRTRERPEADQDELVRVRRAVLALRETRRRAAEDQLRGQAHSGPGRPLLAELAAVRQASAA